MSSINKKCPNCNSMVSATATECHFCKEKISFFSKKQAESSFKEKFDPSMLILSTCVLIGGFAALVSFAIHYYDHDHNYGPEPVASMPAPAPEPAPPPPLVVSSPELVEQEANQAPESYRDQGGDSSLDQAEGPDCGNPAYTIAPYRKQMNLRLYRSLELDPKLDNTTVQIQINFDGKVRDIEVIESGGNPAKEKQLVEKIKTINFDPLPDWYRGEHLTFRFDLAKVLALAPKTKPEMGNIGPYRKDMFRRLKKVMTIDPDIKQLSVQMNVATDGQVNSFRIAEGISTKEIENQLRKEVESANLAPLPEWFAGKEIPFTFSLEKVMDAK